MLILGPLGFSENPDDNTLAQSIIEDRIKIISERGANIPRNKNFIGFLQEHLNEFRAHGKIIEKFGRDPRRNEALRRESTREELDFVEDHEFNEENFNTTE